MIFKIYEFFKLFIKYEEIKNLTLYNNKIL